MSVTTGIAVSVTASNAEILLHEDDEPDGYGNATAQFVAAVTVTNQSNAMTSVSENLFQFSLEQQGGADTVFYLTDDREGGYDSRPLNPGDSMSFKVKCSVTAGFPKAGMDYELTATANELSASTTFQFQDSRPGNPR